MEVAMLTHTHPDEWRDTDPRIVATVLDVEKQQRQKKGRR